MSVDYEYRRRQLAVVTQTIATAMVITRRQNGFDDPHYLAHMFSNLLPSRDLVGYLTDIDQVLIPNLERSEAWRILIPDILKTVEPIRRMDPNPRYGCPLCY
jgi:hypothetical protein